VLRAAQFASRFGFMIVPSTVALCRTVDLNDLPAERLREELYKLLLKSENPSIGLQYLVELGAAEKLFPEVQAMVGCPQRSDYHPEGSVFVHTGMVVDEAAKLSKSLDRESRLVVMLAALCHDFGKPLVTKLEDGVYTAKKHESAGVAPTEAFLERLGVFTENSVKVREQVLKLVQYHLVPKQLYREVQAGNNADRAVRRLAANEVNLGLLAMVSMADSVGRLPFAKEYGVDAEVWFASTALRLQVDEKPLPKLLTGKDLIELGQEPGELFGRVINHVYELQLDGTVSTHAEAVEAAKVFLGL